MSSTAAFYAFIKRESDDGDRWLVTFANRGVADEWWRAISDNPTDCTRGIRRISPQFYSLPPYIYVWDSLNGGQPHRSAFVSRMFFTKLADLGGRDACILPNIDITDHISGRNYYIRSKTTPHQYWTVIPPVVQDSGPQDPLPQSNPPQGGSAAISGEQYKYVYATGNIENRVMFRIVRTGNNTQGTVMIGDDDITISPILPQTSNYGLMNVGIVDGLLAINNLGQSFWKFSAFEDRFYVVRDRQNAIATRENIGEAWGERWELVA